MLKWINNKLVPIVKQVYKVVNVLDTSIAYLFEVMGELDLETDHKVWDALRTVQNAVTVIKSALTKVTDFLDIDLPTVASLEEANLSDEVETLRKML